MERLNYKLIEIFKERAKRDFRTLVICELGNGEYAVSDRHCIAVTSDKYAIVNLGLASPNGKPYRNEQALKRRLDSMNGKKARTLEMTDWAVRFIDGEAPILRTRTHAIVAQKDYIDAFTDKDRFQENVLKLIYLPNWDGSGNTPAIGVYRKSDKKPEGLILPLMTKNTCKRMREIAELKDVFE